MNIEFISKILLLYKNYDYDNIGIILDDFILSNIDNNKKLIGSTLSEINKLLGNKHITQLALISLDNINANNYSHENNLFLKDIEFLLLSDDYLPINKF